VKKIFICTPAYQGTVHVSYALSLTETTRMLSMHGFQYAIHIPTCGSLLVADRNRLIHAFLESGADYMFCIDSDIGWEPQAVMRMLTANKEFVAGVYPSRDGKTFIFRPFMEEDGKIIQCPETSLLKMQCVSAGFMLIARSAIEKMINKFPHLHFKPKDERNTSGEGYCLFNTELIDGEFWGEDYVFCRRAEEAGIDIWVDPYFYFDHAGVKGSLVEILSDKKPE
jgi:hypothetical protein